MPREWPKKMAKRPKKKKKEKFIAEFLGVSVG